ncbi:DUF58 domain-containing protein [Halorarius litoreus]|uniref:DUF58 domain-containing protein n=1 Tax=Halorarius litoreus TaxID=2962676 RepID=UPI0020CE5ED0|nr:DUF58 domain-containing protein [Halorarius litoreus]
MSEPVADPADRTTPETVDRETSRWVGVGAVALVAAALGIAVAQPALLLAGGVGVVFVAYAAVAAPPTGALELVRELDRTDAAPGDLVTVTVRVRNVGDSTLPDVRLVDGVPPGLNVVEGSPRLGTALRPGKHATLRYTVEATRGAHEFDPATVLLRGFSGAIERETTVETSEPTQLTCVPTLSTGVPIPLRAQTTQYTGRVATDTGGAGTEFHAVRDYRPGDPISRIDWRRAARTGEFATVEYRQEQAATVQLVVDTREAAHVGSEDGASAIERSVAAAGEAFTSLLATGDQVGLVAYGPTDAFLQPGAGDEHRARARHLLATDPAFAATPADRPFYASIRLDRLRRRLSPETQVVLFSPMTDEYILSVARRLDAYGHRVTVISPNPCDSGSPGRALARAERDLRLSNLRGAGIRVVDWGEESLATAIAEARTRWSA